MNNRTTMYVNIKFIKIEDVVDQYVVQQEEKEENKYTKSKTIRNNVATPIDPSKYNYNM